MKIRKTDLMNECPSCGTLLKADEKYCSECNKIINSKENHLIWFNTLYIRNIKFSIFILSTSWIISIMNGLFFLHILTLIYGNHYLIIFWGWFSFIMGVILLLVNFLALILYLILKSYKIGEMIAIIIFELNFIIFDMNILAFIIFILYPASSEF